MVVDRDLAEWRKPIEDTKRKTYKGYCSCHKEKGTLSVVEALQWHWGDSNYALAHAF